MGVGDISGDGCGGAVRQTNPTTSTERTDISDAAVDATNNPVVISPSSRREYGAASLLEPRVVRVQPSERARRFRHRVSPPPRALPHAGASFSRPAHRMDDGPCGLGAC